MSDSPSTPAAGGGAAPHPVDAVLAALRAVPDSELRDVLPLQLFAPTPPGAGSAAAGSTR